MQKFIIIMATNINTAFRHAVVKQMLEEFGDVIRDWSVDLDDVDKVLRVVSRRDISFLLLDQLKNSSIYGNLMQVYADADGHPVLLR